MKIIIKIWDDTDALLEKAECGSFESALESLGKMERRYQDELKNPKRENYEDNEAEEGLDFLAEQEAERTERIINGVEE
jgi:hypothetical protein